MTVMERLIWQDIRAAVDYGMYVYQQAQVLTVQTGLGMVV